VDELKFPFGSIRQIRGLLFLDVGAAWTQEGLYWDREIFAFRDFKFYDSDENRFQDGRASYGLGFSFRLGVLDLNWTFARRLPYAETRDTALCDAAIATSFSAIASDCELGETKDSGFKSDFYIGYAF